jgi:hypothetical protein
MNQNELTVAQVAKRFSRTSKAIRNMITAGKLQARLVDAPAPYYLITIESVEAYEASQKQKERNRSDKRLRSRAT